MCAERPLADPFSCFSTAMPFCEEIKWNTSAVCFRHWGVSRSVHDVHTTSELQDETLPWKHLHPWTVRFPWLAPWGIGRLKQIQNKSSMIPKLRRYISLQDWGLKLNKILLTKEWYRFVPLRATGRMSSLREWSCQRSRCTFSALLVNTLF